jgi:holo-[acyl-carrier protein] synthase
MIRFGTDIVYVPRIRSAVDRFGDRFLQRVYTLVERKDCCLSEGANSRTIERLAGRWAAKIAVAKALEIGWRGGSYTDIEIGRQPSGAPRVTLYGDAAAVAVRLCTRDSLLPSHRTWQWHLSLSHDGDYAIATAILTALCLDPLQLN